MKKNKLTDWLVLMKKNFKKKEEMKYEIDEVGRMNKWMNDVITYWIYFGGNLSLTHVPSGFVIGFFECWWFDLCPLLSLYFCPLFLFWFELLCCDFCCDLTGADAGGVAVDGAVPELLELPLPVPAAAAAAAASSCCFKTYIFIDKVKKKSII